MTNKYPPPIISTQPGSWANSTVIERWPKIARRVIEENQFSSRINEQLEVLQADIPHKPIRQLMDQDAPDQKTWKAYIKPHLGKNWLVVPWFFAEMYFYRRVMEAVDYFNLKQDPFSFQKEQGLEKSREDIAVLADFLAENEKITGKGDKILGDAFYFSLWGNQDDLSLWPADSKKDSRQHPRKNLREHLLANDIKQVLNVFSGRDPAPRRVDVMLDNAGFELVSDLALVDILLSRQLAERVILHVKAHPTYVSDVIEDDLAQTIKFLSESGEGPTAQFGKRIGAYVQEGRIEARAHFFWNCPQALWDLPDELRDDLKDSSLLISKGDANYRRILGDREWDFTTPFHKAVDYLPVPLAALRTSKAELVVGMTLDQIQFVFNQDPKWLVNGKWGVIQYAPAANKSEVNGTR